MLAIRDVDRRQTGVVVASLLAAAALGSLTPRLSSSEIIGIPLAIGVGFLILRWPSWGPIFVVALTSTIFAYAQLPRLGSLGTSLYLQEVLTLASLGAFIIGRASRTQPVTRVTLADVAVIGILGATLVSITVSTAFGGYQLKDEISKIIVGQVHVVDDVLTAIFSRGHCLMIGVPGLAKTLMVRTIAQAIDLGTVGRAGESATVPVGASVFVPGSYSFQGVRHIFGGAGSRLIVPHDRVVQVAPELGAKSVLLALDATCHHAVSFGGARQPMTPPDPIVGHGVMGRLLARITLALGMPAPTVWETQPLRRDGATGYGVIHPDEDPRKNYAAIVDISGDGTVLNGLISRLAPGGELILAGFYKQDLSFAFAPAFMREAHLRIAAQWKKQDLLDVTALVERGALSLNGLITHTMNPGRAFAAYGVAFGDPQCLKMMMDWRA